MDPNTALHSILCGHLIADHVEVLRDWLSADGFEPLVCMPADCHEAFSDWPAFPAMVRANYLGLECAVDGITTLTMPWREVLTLTDSECW
jgi:hypothetical protein